MVPNKPLIINSTLWNGGLLFGTDGASTLDSRDYMIQRGLANSIWDKSIVVHVPSSNASNNFAVLSPGANPRFVVNTNTGRVGIGTSNPQGTLDVNGLLVADTTTGRVGIGTAAPVARLDVKQDIPYSTLLGTLTNFSAQTILTNNSGTRLSRLYLGTYNTFGGGAASAIQAASSTDSNSPVVVNNLYINPYGGPVGIGTATVEPTNLLTIQQNIPYVDISNNVNPYPAQLVINGVSERLLLGAYYTGQVGSVCAIQASDKYGNPSIDNPHTLALNPKGGLVTVSRLTPYPNSNLGENDDITASNYFQVFRGIRAQNEPGTHCIDLVKRGNNADIGFDGRTNAEVKAQNPTYTSAITHSRDYTYGFHIYADGGYRFNMRPDNGNVAIGLGTTNASYKLYVNGNTFTKGLDSNGADINVYKADNPAIAVNTPSGLRGGMYLNTGLSPPRLTFDTTSNNYPIHIQGSSIIMGPSSNRVQILGSSGLPTSGNATLMVGSTPVAGYGSNNVNVFSGTASQATVGSVQNNLLISVFGRDYIWCESGFLANSDMRIKKNITEINDGDALNKIRLIEPSEYDYIDIRKGTNRVYGFIAQQVYQHFPDVSPKARQTIPVFYQLCDASFNESHLTLVDISNREVLASVVPGKSKVQIIDIVGKEHTPPVIAVDASAGTLTFDISGLGVTEDASGGKMFLYGMEVDDFHTLNKDYLFTINFAATQEIDREVQRLRKDNTALTGRVATLESQVTTLEVQNTALQQKLDTLLARLGITDL